MLSWTRFRLQRILWNYRLKIDSYDVSFSWSLILCFCQIVFLFYWNFVHIPTTFPSKDSPNPENSDCKVHSIFKVIGLNSKVILITLLRTFHVIHNLNGFVIGPMNLSLTKEWTSWKKWPDKRQRKPLSSPKRSEKTFRKKTSIFCSSTSSG